MGGNITIDTNILEALNGGQLNAASLSSGDAGNITLNVTAHTSFSRGSFSSGKGVIGVNNAPVLEPLGVSELFLEYNKSS